MDDNEFQLLKSLVEGLMKDDGLINNRCNQPHGPASDKENVREDSVPVKDVEHAKPISAKCDDLVVEDARELKYVRKCVSDRFCGSVWAVVVMVCVLMVAAAWIINMIFNLELVQWEKIVFSSFILLAIVLFAFGVVYLLCDSQKKWGEKCFPLKMKVLDFEQQMGKECFELKNAQNIAYRKSVEQQLDLQRRYEMMRIEEEQYEAETRRKTMQKKLEVLDNIASKLAMESSHKSQ